MKSTFTNQWYTWQSRSSKHTVVEDTIYVPRLYILILLMAVAVPLQIIKDDWQMMMTKDIISDTVIIYDHLSIHSSISVGRPPLLTALCCNQYPITKRVIYSPLPLSCEIEASQRMLLGCTMLWIIQIDLRCIGWMEKSRQQWLKMETLNVLFDHKPFGPKESWIASTVRD